MKKIEFFVKVPSQKPKVGLKTKDVTKNKEKEEHQKLKEHTNNLENDKNEPNKEKKKIVHGFPFFKSKKKN